MRFLSSIFALVWAVIKSFIIVAAVFVLLALALVPDADAQTPPECPAGAADCQGAALPFDAPGADESWFYNPNTGQIYFFRSTGLTFALVAIFFALMIVAYFRFTGLRFLDLVGERFDLPPGYQEERMANPEDVPWTSHADGAVRSEYHKAAAQEAKDFARWRQEVKDLFGDDIHFDSFAEARRHKEESEAYYYGAAGDMPTRGGGPLYGNDFSRYGGGNAGGGWQESEAYYHGTSGDTPTRGSAPLHGTDFGGGDDPYGEDARANQAAVAAYNEGVGDGDTSTRGGAALSGNDFDVDDPYGNDSRSRAAEAAAYNRGEPVGDSPTRGGERLRLKEDLRLEPVGGRPRPVAVVERDTERAVVHRDDYSQVA